MNKKVYVLKDNDKLTFTGKQLREWEKIIISETINHIAEIIHEKIKKKVSKQLKKEVGKIVIRSLKHTSIKKRAGERLI